MAALNAEISLELKKAFDKTCIDREVSQKAAVADAIQSWIDGQPAVDTADFGTLTAQEFAYLQAALGILREKPKFGLQAITGALDAWLIDHPVEKRHDKRRKSSGH